MRLIIEVKNPTEELTGICTFSFWSWDISLSLNMTVAVKLFFFFKLRYADHVRNGHRKRYSVSGGF